jgi:hypothetical protein
MTGLSAYFYSRRDMTVQREGILYGIIFVSILVQIGAIHLPVAVNARPFAMVAANGGVIMGRRLILGSENPSGLAGMPI